MDSKQKKTVYLIRHGQSIDNASPVFQATNSPLSKIGRQQAKSIANRMSTIPFDALISSTVQRAKETAEHISKTTQKNIIFSDLFVERIKPKELDGKSWKDEQANKLWRDYESSLYNPELKINDSENYDDIVKRVDKALAFLIDRPESCLTVVTHGYFLRAVVARILMKDHLTAHVMKQFQINASMMNTGITVIEHRDTFEEEPSWRLWTYNDHAHL